MLSALEVSLPTGSGIATYPPGGTFGPRLVHDFEFVWMIEGDAEYRWGDVVVVAPEGSIVLCHPGATDFFRWDPSRRTQHGFLHFDLLSFPVSWPPVSSWPLVRVPENDDILWPLFRSFVAGRGRHTDWEQRLTIAHALTAFLAGVISGRFSPVWPEPVERAWAWLHSRLEDSPEASITLDNLAEAACVTPEHLCRLFRAAVGSSPVETVRLVRLDRSATLLARSNYSISEIAEIYGFASPFHFSRCFKTAFGQSPRDYRKALALGASPPSPLVRR